MPKIASASRRTNSGLRRLLPRILLQCDWLLRFFHEFFKARVAAQWIPERQQFQLAVTEAASTADDAGKLFASEIFVANPRSDHRQIPDHF